LDLIKEEECFALDRTRVRTKHDGLEYLLDLKPATKGRSIPRALEVQLDEAIEPFREISNGDRLPYLSGAA
jgi:hypothetical protein